jgi:hypothetical protein
MDPVIVSVMLDYSVSVPPDAAAGDTWASLDWEAQLVTPNKKNATNGTMAVLPMRAMASP